MDNDLFCLLSASSILEERRIASVTLVSFLSRMIEALSKQSSQLSFYPGLPILPQKSLKVLRFITKTHNEC